MLYSAKMNDGAMLNATAMFSRLTALAAGLFLLGISACTNMPSDHRAMPSERVVPNALKNPDVEDSMVLSGGTPEGHWYPFVWVTAADMELSEPGYSSKHSLSIKSVVPMQEVNGAKGYFDPRGTAGWFYYSIWHQDKDKRFIPVNRNTDYLFSVFARATEAAVNDALIYVRLYWAPNHDNNWKTRTVTQELVLKSDFQRFHLWVSTTAIDSDDIYAQINVASYPTSGQIWYDQMDFHEADASEIEKYRNPGSDDKLSIGVTDSGLILAGTGARRVAMDAGGRWWMVDPLGRAGWMRGVSVQDPQPEFPEQHSWIKANYATMADYRSARVYGRLKAWNFNAVNLNIAPGHYPDIPGSGEENFYKWFEVNINRSSEFLGRSNWQNSLLHDSMGDSMDKRSLSRYVPDLYLQSTIEDMRQWSRSIIQATVTTYSEAGLILPQGNIQSGSLEYWIWDAPGGGHDGVCEQFLNWLAQRYDSNIAKLNSAWETQFETFNEIGDQRPYPDSYDAMSDDMKLFAREVLYNYLKQSLEIIRERPAGRLVVSPRLDKYVVNQMYADGNQDLLSIYDVLMISSYYDVNRNTAGFPQDNMDLMNQLYDLLKIPVIYAGLSYASRETGFEQNVDSVVFDTQALRARAMSNSVIQLATMPFTAGYYWNYWADEYWSGNRNNSGLVRGASDSSGSVDREYYKLVTEATEAQAQIALMDPESRTGIGSVSVTEGNFCLCSSSSSGTGSILVLGLVIGMLARRRFG